MARSTALALALGLLTAASCAPTATPSPPQALPSEAPEPSKTTASNRESSGQPPPAQPSQPAARHAQSDALVPMAPSEPAGQATLGPNAPTDHAALRKPTDWLAAYNMPAHARVALAKQRKLPEVQQLFSDAAVDFPPAELLFRAFKRERLLEVWASSERGARLHAVATYEICALSGEIGPKRHEGDQQVPEGFYRIAYLWPLSAFHLSMNIGYPNRSDRILGGREPGSAIMIHGNCVSIGCLAMSDERIQELWVMASAVQERGQRIHVHLFPSVRIDELLQDEAYRTHWDFWKNLQEGLELFEQHQRLPQVEVDWQGRYAFRVPDGSGA